MKPGCATMLGRGKNGNRRRIWISKNTSAGVVRGQRFEALTGEYLGEVDSLHELRLGEGVGDAGRCRLSGLAERATFDVSFDFASELGAQV